MKKLLAFAAAAALACGFSLAASAQTGASTEINTAHAHALMAQAATSLDMAHTHLHHVINCLVGPKGAGFDATAGDPCKSQGNGAIPDSASNAALDSKLKAALAQAEAGLQTTELAAAQQDAAKVAATLQSTPKQNKMGAYSW